MQQTVARLQRAARLAQVDVGRAHLDPAPLGVADEARRRVKAHRLLVQEPAEELGRIVVAQPCRLVGEQAERGGVRLREPEAREADERVEDAVGHLLGDALRDRALDEARPVRLERLVAPLAAHRAPQPFRLADREPRERDRDVEHLVLEHDDAERRGEWLAERLVRDSEDERRVLSQPAAMLDVGVHGLALDRSGPDERDLDREVVDRLGLRAEQALHLRAALDLEHADGVGRLDLGEDGGIVERDAREVDRRAVEPGDLLDALLDAGEHPEPEQVDLEEPCVGARVLVPLAELAARHRRSSITTWPLVVSMISVFSGSFTFAMS